MEKISDNINKMFENLFKTDDNIHPFFKDLKRVPNIAKSYIDDMKKHIKTEVNYTPNNNIPEGKLLTPKYDILSLDELKKLDKEINNMMNYVNILSIVSFLSQYVIQSNITNEDKLYKNIAKDDCLNVMIIGSGPVGLFLACYLNLYYNDTRMNSYPRLNIVMYDSRIDKPGIRKPYNRQRLFGTSSNYLSLIIPKLYCWNEKNNKDYIMVNIFILEYVLFTIANLHYNIPMIYKDYSWDDYVNIIDKGKFDVVFDCTGGKLSHNAIKNIDASWLKKIPLYDSIVDRKLEINLEKNLVLLENDSKHIVNYFYGSLTLSYNNESLTFYNKFDIDIMNKEDLIYLNKVKSLYDTQPEAMSIIKGIRDDMTRNFLYNIMNGKYTNYLVSFDIWGIYIRHAIKISDVFTVNKRKILFVGAGDTIFHSHYLTGSGLNRILDFTVKCSNLIGQIK